MDKKKLKAILAPIGVAFGVFVVIIVSSLITKTLGYIYLPKNILAQVWPQIIGVVLFISWLPVFIAGFYYLGRRGAVGQSDILTMEGIYKYIRNPMYSGLSFTIFGFGLIIDRAGVVLAGVIWLALACIQGKREEKELEGRFGDQYLNYKKTVPMFFPKFFKRPK